MNFFRNKPLIITIIIIVLLIFLMAGTVNSDAVSNVSSAVAAPLVPIQQFFYGISQGTTDFFDRAFNKGTSSEQIKILEDELETLKIEYADYNELKEENKRLSEMLEYRQNNESSQLKVARIIGKDPGNWFSVFSINLGYNDGIRQDMAIITPEGLVGRVEEVGMNWSKIIAIVDGRSGVSSIVERTRDVGIVRGTVGNDDSKALLTMNFLPIDTDIVEGDKVLSSGLDGIYPKGVLIGTVSKSKEGTSTKNVTIKPAVDFSKLEEVIVMIPTENSEPVTNSDSTGGTVVPPMASAPAEPQEAGDTYTAQGTPATQTPIATQTPEPTQNGENN